MEMITGEIDIYGSSSTTSCVLRVVALVVYFANINAKKSDDGNQPVLYTLNVAPPPQFGQQKCDVIVVHRLQMKSQITFLLGRWNRFVRSFGRLLQLHILYTKKCPPMECRFIVSFVHVSFLYSNTDQTDHHRHTKSIRIKGITTIVVSRGVYDGKYSSKLTKNIQLKFSLKSTSTE